MNYLLNDSWVTKLLPVEIWLMIIDYNRESFEKIRSQLNVKLRPRPSLNIWSGVVNVRCYPVDSSKPVMSLFYDRNLYFYTFYFEGEPRKYLESHTIRDLDIESKYHRQLT